MKISTMRKMGKITLPLLKKKKKKIKENPLGKMRVLGKKNVFASWEGVAAKNFKNNTMYKISQ